MSRTAKGRKKKPAGHRSPPAGPPDPVATATAAAARDSSTSRLTLVVLAGLLVIVTLAVFAPLRHADFVQLDDPVYVTENPGVTGGLTLQSAAWAFTAVHAGYWHPLTWLSHMLDVQLFGMDGGLHHVTNIVLHLANTLLLFFLLCRMTGAAGRSALVAALFAVHPLHVESVAWVAERKDVLSTFFLMLTLWAYLWHLRRPGIGRYSVVLVCFALGLMAKPMIVTLPFVLLLIDAWPLGRVSFAGGTRATWLSLLREKLPLLGLAAIAAVVVFVTQRQVGAVGGLEAYPPGLRVENALVSYVAYLWHMVWPMRLAAFYSFPEAIPASWVAGGVLLLAAVTVAAIVAARRHPYLLVGWLWYLGMLVPVIGLVQVGLQSMADRFTYVPLIGIFIMVAWGAPLALGRWAAGRLVLPPIAVATVLACAVMARTQVGYWSDSVALWTRATMIELNLDSYSAHMRLGATLAKQGRQAEAEAHFSEAVRLRPAAADARYELALSLANQGRMDAAIGAVREAIRLKPAHAEAHGVLGQALAATGRTDEAITEYREALRLKPDLAEVHNNLGVALAGAGRIDEALPCFADAVRLKPDFERAHVNLGLALVKTGRAGEAIQQFTDALRLNPANEVARRALDELTKSGRR